MASSPRWPEPPSPGESVRLPLPCPSMLLEAIGYHGGARFVALCWWAGGGGNVLCADGESISIGWWPAWQLLVREHPVGRIVLGPYELGDNAGPAAHWLLIDRWAGTLEVAEARDVEQLLRTQPSESAALATETERDPFDPLSDRTSSEATLRHELMLGRNPPERDRDLKARAARLQALRCWLDRRLPRAARARELSAGRTAAQRRGPLAVTNPEPNARGWARRAEDASS